MADRISEGQNTYRTTNIADHANAILGNTYGDTFQIFVLGNNDVETVQPIALSSLLLMRQLKSLKESGQLACSSQGQEKHRSLERTRAHQIPVLGRDIKAASNRFPLAEVPSTNRFEATAVLTILFGAVAYRHLPLTVLYDVFVQSTTDGVTTGVMMLFLAWLTNFLTRASLSTSMSGTSGDKLTFENAYKQRMQVPLAYFASEDIFRGFLRTHYKDSSAIKLVEAGSFYFMLGERFRQPVGLAALCSGKLAPSHVVIMSIRYRAWTTSCIECTNKLYSSDTQSYLCSYCRRHYCIRENILPPSKCLNTAAFLQPKSRLLAWTFWTGTLDGLQNVDLDILPQRRPQPLQQPSVAYTGRKRANYKSATTSRTTSRLHDRSFLQKLIRVIPRATDMPDFNGSVSLNRRLAPALTSFHDSTFETPVPGGYIANPMARDTSLESNVSEPFPAGYAAKPMARDTSVESNLSDPLPNTSSDGSSSYILIEAIVRGLAPEQSFNPKLPTINENKACQTPVLHQGSYEASLSEPSPIASPMRSPGYQHSLSTPGGSIRHGSLEDDDRCPLSSKNTSNRIHLPRLDVGTLSRNPTRRSESRQKKCTLSRGTIGQQEILYRSSSAGNADASEDEDEDDEPVSEGFATTTEEDDDDEDRTYRWWKTPSPKLSTQHGSHPQDDPDSTKLIITPAILAKRYSPEILLTKDPLIDRLSTRLSSLRPAATGICLSQVDTTIAIGQIGSSLAHTNQITGLTGTYAMDKNEYLISQLKRASR